MAFKWRKWNRIVHRDLGYFFFGMTIIYAISGIAINHLKQWDPNFKITRTEIQIEENLSKENINKEFFRKILEPYGEAANYKKYYFPDDNNVKLFLDKGSVEINLATGNGVIETIRRRPIISHSNYLHYNPIKYWTWFSDAFCVALIIIAISGLFIIKGRKGITGRGAWLTAIGIIIPIIYLIILL
jgi:uncharacterized protein